MNDYQLAQPGPSNTHIEPFHSHVVHHHMIPIRSPFVLLHLFSLKLTAKQTSNVTSVTVEEGKKITKIVLKISQQKPHRFYSYRLFEQLMLYVVLFFSRQFYNYDYMIPLNRHTNDLWFFFFSKTRIQLDISVDFGSVFVIMIMLVYYCQYSTGVLFDT